MDCGRRMASTVTSLYMYNTALRNLTGSGQVPPQAVQGN
jgi:hypothetical protein